MINWNTVVRVDGENTTMTQELLKITQLLGGRSEKHLVANLRDVRRKLAAGEFSGAPEFRAHNGFLQILIGNTWVDVFDFSDVGGNVWEEF